MYHVSAQGVDERMINVHYYYYYLVAVFETARLHYVQSTVPCEISLYELVIRN